MSFDALIGNNCCSAQETFKNCADVSILNSARDIIESSSKAEVPVAVPEPDESVWRDAFTDTYVNQYLPQKIETKSIKSCCSYECIFHFIQ